MRLYFNRRAAFYPQDSRVCILTFEWMPWKTSISIHPRLFRFRQGFREFRLTVMGINLHYVNLDNFDRA